MANNRFRGKAGRFGTQLSYIEGGNAGPISPVSVASSTVVYRIATPRRRMYVESLSFQQSALANGAAAITVQVFKRNSVGSVSQALCAATDIKSGAVDSVRDIPITATENQRTLQDGDYLAFDIVAAGTITAQPTNFFVTAEVAVLE